MDYNEKTIEELQDELKNIKDVLAKKKEEDRAAKREEREKEKERKREEAKKKKAEDSIPDNIKKIPEYGWVKILPVGPGETVYTWEIEYVKKGKTHKTLILTTAASAGFYHDFNEQGEIPILRVIAIPMRISYYPQFGKKVFLSEKEARQAMIGWIKESFTDKGLQEVWHITPDSEANQ